MSSQVSGKQHSATFEHNHHNAHQHQAATSCSKQQQRQQVSKLNVKAPAEDEQEEAIKRTGKLDTQADNEDNDNNGNNKQGQDSAHHDESSAGSWTASNGSAGTMTSGLLRRGPEQKLSVVLPTNQKSLVTPTIVTNESCPTPSQFFSSLLFNSQEVGLFTGLPSCTPTSADALVTTSSLGINPFFYGVTTFNGGNTELGAANTNGSHSDQDQQQQRQQQQQQQQQQADEQKEKPASAKHERGHQLSKLSLDQLQAANAAIMLSPLPLWLSPEHDALIQYGLSHSNQHPLAGKTATPVDPTTSANHHHHHHQVYGNNVSEASALAAAAYHHHQQQQQHHHHHHNHQKQQHDLNFNNNRATIEAQDLTNHQVAAHQQNNAAAVAAAAKAMVALKSPRAGPTTINSSYLPRIDGQAPLNARGQHQQQSFHGSEQASGVSSSNDIILTTTGDSSANKSQIHTTPSVAVPFSSQHKQLPPLQQPVLGQEAASDQHHSSSRLIYAPSQLGSDLQVYQNSQQQQQVSMAMRNQNPASVGPPAAHHHQQQAALLVMGSNSVVGSGAGSAQARMVDFHNQQQQQHHHHNQQQQACMTAAARQGQALALHYDPGLYSSHELTQIYLAHQHQQHHNYHLHQQQQITHPTQQPITSYQIQNGYPTHQLQQQQQQQQTAAATMAAAQARLQGHAQPQSTAINSSVTTAATSAPQTTALKLAAVATSSDSYTSEHHALTTKDAISNPGSQSSFIVVSPRRIDLQSALNVNGVTTDPKSVSSGVEETGNEAPGAKKLDGERAISSPANGTALESTTTTSAATTNVIERTVVTKLHLKRTTTVNSKALASFQGNSQEPDSMLNGDEVVVMKKKSKGGRKKKLVTHEELIARKNRSKERNRVAAKRCRQKRKQFLDELRGRIDNLNDLNRKLQKENTMLKSELELVKQHHETCRL